MFNFLQQDKIHNLNFFVRRRLRETMFVCWLIFFLISIDAHFACRGGVLSSQVLCVSPDPSTAPRSTTTLSNCLQVIALLNKLYSQNFPSFFSCAELFMQKIITNGKNVLLNTFRKLLVTK